jgi:hypothetical protein
LIRELTAYKKDFAVPGKIGSINIAPKRATKKITGIAKCFTLLNNTAEWAKKVILNHMVT